MTTRKNEGPLYNQLSRGVYVEGQGVVQPGERISKSKASDEDVQVLAEAGVLAPGKPGSADDEDSIPVDPHPPTVEVDAGFPGTNDNEKEADNAA